MIFTPHWYTVARVAQLLSYGGEQGSHADHHWSAAVDQGRAVLVGEAHVQDRVKATGTSGNESDNQWFVWYTTIPKGRNLQRLACSQHNSRFAHNFQRAGEVRVINHVTKHIALPGTLAYLSLVLLHSSWLDCRSFRQRLNLS
jgi:hypothetical protein